MLKFQFVKTTLKMLFCRCFLKYNQGFTNFKMGSKDPLFGVEQSESDQRTKEFKEMVKCIPDPYSTAKYLFNLASNQNIEISFQPSVSSDILLQCLHDTQHRRVAYSTVQWKCKQAIEN